MASNINTNGSGGGGGLSNNNLNNIIVPNILSSSAPAASSHFPPHLSPSNPSPEFFSSSSVSSTTPVSAGSHAAAALAAAAAAAASLATMTYRIQIFPHREGFGNPLSGPLPPAGFNFSPIEMDLSPNVVVRIGRKVDRQKEKDKEKDKEAKNAKPVTVGPGPASANVGASSLVLNNGTTTNTSTSSLPASASASRASVVTGPSGTVISPNDMDHILGVVQTGTEPSVNDADVMSPYAAVQTVGRRDFATEDVGAATVGTSSKAGATATAVPKTDFIAFRSKVVSRTHAELWLADDGQVMFKDVGSSSGTFLNRLRLSPSGRESRPYPIKSGDVIQLGVDYQGRQEEIYKCVQMKVFVSQKSKERPKTNPARLRLALKILLAAMNPSARDASDASCTDCCICLSTLSPQQALFLAPCSHCFHYRCVMPLLGSNIMFQCPLCRQVANLDANVIEDDNGVDYLSSSSDDGVDEERQPAGAVDEEWARSILAFEGLNLGNSTASPVLRGAVPVVSPVVVSPGFEVPALTMGFVGAGSSMASTGSSMTSASSVSSLESSPVRGGEREREGGASPVLLELEEQR